MQLKFLVGAVLIVSLSFVGCKEPEVATPGPKTTDKKVDDLAEYRDFKVDFPEEFDGDFNPEGLEVGAQVGQLAPEIEGKDLDGNEFKLSDYRGKVVMLDFYGDW